MKIINNKNKTKKYYHGVIGWNGRMDGFQGAVLSVKLKYLDKWNDARRSNSDRYFEALNGQKGLVLPREADYAKHVFHLFAIRVAQRDSLIDTLGKK